MEDHKMKVLEGKVVADGAKIGIVAARFNEFIVSKSVKAHFRSKRRSGTSQCRG